MERRKAIAKDGKPYGKRHKVCQPCMTANAIQQDEYRKRVYLNGGSLYRPACGVRRRLQALAVRGWTFREIGRRFGRDATVLSHMASTKNKKFVLMETLEKISALYNELSMVPPPEDYPSKRQATRGRGLGYLPPLCWDEETIDNPYALPTGMSRRQAFDWFWHAASDIEKVEWVLEHGLGITRVKWYTQH